MNLALFLKYVSLSFQKKLSYRFELVLEIFTSIFFRFCISYFLWSAVYEYAGAEVLNGFTFIEMMTYYFMVPFVGKISKPKDSVEVSMEIYDGGLNKFLLYPSSYFFVKYAEFASQLPYYFIQFVLGAVLFQYFFSVPVLDIFISPRFLLFIPFALLANLMMFLVFLCVEQIAFWADHVWSLSVFVRFLTGILGGAMIPLSFFSDSSLVYIRNLPFQYFFSVPISILRGDYPMGNLYLDIFKLLSWILFFFLAAKWIWARGRWKYSGVGI